jgi:hypothetical protein
LVALKRRDSYVKVAAVKQYGVIAGDDIEELQGVKHSICSATSCLAFLGLRQADAADKEMEGC